MPAGFDVTVPAPLPVLVTVSVNRCSVNVAVTPVAAVIVVVHVDVPVQPPPDQPVKVEPVAGVAVRTTDWLKLKSAAHVAPQLMPAGFDVTVPAPLPALVTVSVRSCSGDAAVPPV